MHRPTSQSPHHARQVGPVSFDTSGQYPEVVQRSLEVQPSAAVDDMRSAHRIRTDADLPHRTTRLAQAGSVLPPLTTIPYQSLWYELGCLYPPDDSDVIKTKQTDVSQTGILNLLTCSFPADSGLVTECNHISPLNDTRNLMSSINNGISSALYTHFLCLLIWPTNAKILYNI